MCVLQRGANAIKFFFIALHLEDYTEFVEKKV